jgi:hypothetical protein
MQETKLSVWGQVIKYIIIVEGVLIILVPILLFFFGGQGLGIVMIFLGPIIEIIVLPIGSIMIFSSLKAERDSWHTNLLFMVSSLFIILMISFAFLTHTNNQYESITQALFSWWPFYLFGIQLFVLTFFLRKSIQNSNLSNDKVTSSVSNAEFDKPSNKKAFYIILFSSVVSLGLTGLFRIIEISISNSALLSVFSLLLFFISLILTLFIFNKILILENPEFFARRLALFYIVYAFLGYIFVLLIPSSEGVINYSQWIKFSLFVISLLHAVFAYCVVKIFILLCRHQSNNQNIVSAVPVWESNKKGTIILLIIFIILSFPIVYFEQKQNYEVQTQRASTTNVPQTIQPNIEKQPFVSDNSQTVSNSKIATKTEDSRTVYYNSLKRDFVCTNGFLSLQPGVGGDGKSVTDVHFIQPDPKYLFNDQMNFVIISPNDPSQYFIVNEYTNESISDILQNRAKVNLVLSGCKNSEDQPFTQLYSLGNK